MTWVVIALMIAFVGGSALQQILSRMGGGQQVVGRYGEKSQFLWVNKTPKITVMDRQAARQDLQILGQLSIKEFLRGWPSPINPRQPSFKTLLLGQLLFPDSQISPAIAQMLKSSGQSDLDDETIDSFFDELKGMPDIYWILLRAEAHNAGVYVPLEQAKAYLKSFIPQISQNKYDAATVVNAIMNQSNITEEKIISTFADLLSIMLYTDMVLSSEDVTTDQIRAFAGQANEKINAEYVAFDSSDFLEGQAEPSDAEISAQFEKYKSFTQGTFSENNPFGFGYLLPARVQLEYIAVLTGDIKETIDKPTSQEMESYYQNNLSSFVTNQPSDPEDPESEKVQTQQTYAQVEQNIRYTLTTRKTNNKADLIMNEAVMLTDPGLSSEQIESMSADDIKSKAADFADSAKKLSDKFGVRVYSGKTGYLGIEDLAADKYLGRLTIEGANQQQLPLAKALFAIDQLKVTALGRFEGTAPKMWVNIGPMKDQFARLAILVRIVDAKQPEIAPGPDFSFSRETLAFDPDEQQEQEDNIFSVRQLAAEDVKHLKAFGAAQAKAKQFLDSVRETGWDKAIENYNNALAKPEDTEDADSGKIALEQITDRTIPSDADMKNMQKLIDDNPSMAGYLQSNYVSMRLLRQLKNLCTDAKATDKILDLKPALSCYAVKSAEAAETTKQDYAKAKSQIAWGLDGSSAESLAVVHYNPANLTARMKFDFVQRQDEDQEDSIEADDKTEQ